MEVFIRIILHMELSDKLIENNFVSVFETTLKDMRYICPIGVLWVLYQTIHI